MKVIIIYNPNSTGASEDNAKQFAKELRAKGVEVDIKKTTHAGHGEELAYEYGKTKESIVLISSSGDGGYHEVVNGALASRSKRLVVGVLPSGNANDHFTALGDGLIAEKIAKNRFKHIDTIRVTAKVDGKAWTRYAHSYAGIGVTANAAIRLTEDRPNVLTEKWIVAHSLLSFRYVKVKEGRDTRRYSSIIFGNIQKMSKVLKLSSDSSVTDGKFEMTSIRFRSKLRLIGYLITLATIGIKSRTLSKFIFRTIDPLPIQLDGEVYMLDAHTKVKIESVKQNLRCAL